MATTLLKLADAADFLSMSRRSLDRYMLRPDFPKKIKVSRRQVYLVKEELIKWAKSHRVPERT